MKSLLLILCLFLFQTAHSESEWPTFYMKRGDSYLQQGLYEEAIADYERVVEMLPKAVDARIRIGYVYLRQGDCDRGYAWFEDAIGIFPEFAEYDFVERLKTNPEDADAHYGLALSYAAQGYWKAEREFETCKVVHSRGIF